MLKMSDGGVVMSQQSIERIEVLERNFAVISTRFDSLERTTNDINSTLKDMARNRMGLKDVWQPMGIAVIIISGIAGLAMQAPLGRLDRIEHHLDYTDVQVQTAATERQSITARVDRIEATMDDRNNARFLMQSGVPMPVAKKVRTR